MFSILQTLLRAPATRVADALKLKVNGNDHHRATLLRELTVQMPRGRTSSNNVDVTDGKPTKKHSHFFTFFRKKVLTSWSLSV